MKGSTKLWLSVGIAVSILLWGEAITWFFASYGLPILIAVGKTVVAALTLWTAYCCLVTGVLSWWIKNVVCIFVNSILL